jgi:hypothetical protein
MPSSLNQELTNLRERGFVLPRNSGRAVEALRETYQVERQVNQHSERQLAGLSARLGRTVTSADYDSPEVQRIMSHNDAMTRAMGQSRALSSRMQRQASIPGGSPDVHGGMPRWYDPLEYWDLSGLPWNVADEGHRHKLHKWLRLYYATHYLVPILVDIFTRFPLVGMELECRDPKLKEFYEELFFNQLNYEEFLVSLGREFWVVGEAFPLGSFNESAGVWEREELINPEDVVVKNIPILGGTEMKIAPPDYLKRLAQTQNPPKEYMLLKNHYPELIPYLLKGEQIPISPVLMRQVGNKLNDWDDRGTPILLRGLRTLLHEEKLMASQDAIAERLYSPLLLAKLGIQDMGDGQAPWLPGPDELESVRDDLDVALSSDFRVMVHHFGLELQSVFGREQMPRLGDDFDRIERRLMQVFGVNPSLLSAGSGGQPYASSALQAEFLNQILRTFQKTLVKHFEARALVVAEAQGHYDYEQKGQTRVQLFEEVVEYDDDYNMNIVEVPKLLIPDLKFQTLDLRDEATERQFLQTLREMGIPISDQRLAIGVSFNIKEEYALYNREVKEKTIAQQRAKFETYTALTIQGLPVPTDLKAEVESVLQPSGMAPAGGEQPAMPGPGPSAGPGGSIMMPNPPGDLNGGLGPGGMGGTVPGGGPPPATPEAGGPAGAVPDVSNERRPGLTYNTRTASDEVNWVADATRMVRESGISPNVAGVKMREQLLSDGAEEEFAQRIVSTWLESLFHIADLQVDDEPATLPETVEEEPAIPVEKWELAKGQELRAEKDDLPERITTVARKKEVRYKVDPEKKYSIVDPEATPLEEEHEQERQPAGQTSGTGQSGTGGDDPVRGD